MSLFVIVLFLSMFMWLTYFYDSCIEIGRGLQPNQSAQALIGFLRNTTDLNQLLTKNAGGKEFFKQHF